MSVPCLSRRFVLGAGVALPGLTLLSTLPLGREERLRDLLSRIEAGLRDAQLDLVRYQEHDGMLSAVVRLRWSPGTRQRNFRTADPDGEAAFVDVASQIADYYGSLTSADIT